jgi:N-carbamoyl-L-amino-acid hydrolase
MADTTAGAPLRINRERLMQSFERFNAIGATGRGGCNRQALTDEDKAGRDLFCAWAREAGCSVRVDGVGNLFARRDSGSPLRGAVGFLVKEFTILTIPLSLQPLYRNEA